MSVHHLPAHRIHSGREAPALGAARDTFLASITNDNTRKSHAAAVNNLVGGLDPQMPLHDLQTEHAADRIAEIFHAQWGARAPNTRATRWDGLCAAISYWQRQGWLPEDLNPLRRITRPVRQQGRDRAWPRAQVQALLRRRDLPLRERLLYTMLYETAARVEEVLSLNVEDLDRPNRQVVIIRKGGASDTIIWQTATATLLPRYLKGRPQGPLFLTHIRSRVELPPCDLCPDTGLARLSYSRVAEIWKEEGIPGGPGDGIHGLRHTALTHAAEDGMNTPMLKRKSGHRSVTSLARYANPSVEALRRWQDEHDPARRSPHRKRTDMVDE